MGEINPNHPVVTDLLSKVKANKEDTAAMDTAQVLFQTALLESGYDVSDPTSLVNRVYRLMSKELGVDPDAPLAEVEVRRMTRRKKPKRRRSSEPLFGPCFGGCWVVPQLCTRAAFLYSKL